MAYSYKYNPLLDIGLDITGIEAEVNYPEVNTFADLPSAASNSGNIYYVRTKSGSMWTMDRHDVGFYRSNGVTWLTTDIPGYFKSGEFAIQDNTDITKQLVFDVSSFTTATSRTVTWQNKNITVAGINNETFTGTSTFDEIFLNDTGVAKSALKILTTTRLRIGQDFDILDLVAGGGTAKLVLAATTITAHADTDSTNIFGRTRLDSRTSDFAFFSHFDRTSSSEYALRQGTAGHTTVNAVTGQTVRIAIQNTNIATFGTAGIDFTAPLTVTSTTTSPFDVVGAAAGGNVFSFFRNNSAFNTSNAVGFDFRVLNNASASTPAAQVLSGLSTLTAGTEIGYYTIKTRSGGGSTDRLTINSTAATFSVPVVSSSDSDSTHILGRARIHSPIADSLFIAHYDFSTNVNYALFQGSSGQTALNAATGQNLTLRVNNSILVTLSSTLFTLAVPTKLPSYTVASVPNATTLGAGTMIYVSNETGGAVVAFSDGTDWRRVTDRTIIA